MATRLSPNPTPDQLRARKQDAEARANMKREKQDRQVQWRLGGLFKKCGLTREPDDVLLGILIDARARLDDPHRCHAYRAELREIASFGAPALVLDQLIEEAIVAHAQALHGSTVDDDPPEAAEPTEEEWNLPPGTVGSDEAVRITGWSKTTLLKAVRDGRLPAQWIYAPAHSRCVGGWRYNPDDLMKFRKADRKPGKSRHSPA